MSLQYNMALTGGARASSNARVCVFLLFGAMAAFQLVQQIHIIAFSYPLDYRENVVLYRAALIAHGQSPYSHLPASQSQYGFVTDYFGALGMLLTGPSFVAPRFISAVAMLLWSALLGVYAMRRTADWLTGFAVFAFGYVSSFSHPETALAFPNALGSLFFLSSILVPLLGEFSVWSLAVGLAAAWLGFFAKVYLGLGPAFIIAWLLLSRRWREASLFAAASIALLCVSLFVIARVFPDYLDSTLGLVPAPLGWDAIWLLLQSGYFLLVALPLVLYLAHSLRFMPNQQRRAVLKGFNGVCAAIALLILLKIGGNKLQYYLYFYQFLFPFLLLLGIDCAGAEGKEKRNLLICLFANTALMLLVAQQHTPLTQVEQSFQNIAAKLPNGDLSRVLLDPPASFFAIRRGQDPADVGQREFLRDAPGRPHSLFLAAQADVEAKKRAGFYALVLTDGLQPAGNQDLDRCYDLASRQLLPLYAEDVAVDVWMRKPACESSGGRP
jgi:hypothetical protein